MKKIAIWFLVGLAIFIFFTAPIAWYSYTVTWKYEAEYEKYADDFNTVKNYIAKEFPNESDKLLLVSTAKEHDGLTLYDVYEEKYLNLPSDVSTSLELIEQNAFPDKDSNFYDIRIQKDRIAFGIECGHYELVYSPNKKPTWLGIPKENETVKAKKAGTGWYHVVYDHGLIESIQPYITILFS